MASRWLETPFMTLDESETLLRAERPKDDSWVVLKLIGSLGALIFGVFALFYLLTPMVARLLQH